jgi:hypothetical protein
MKATIGGKEFWAVGLIEYEEFDSEDGRSVWYEWVLLNPDGDLRYLEFDEGRWTLTEAYSPKNDGALVGAFGAGTGAVFDFDGDKALVRETGIGTISGFDGEIPWEIHRGERIRYTDLESANGNTFYSGEMSEQNGEIEWFHGKRMDDRLVFALFGLSHLSTKLERQDSRKKNQGFFGCISILLAIAAFVFTGTSGCQGKIVGQGTVTAAQIPEEGKRFGPYKLAQANRVYRLRVSSQLTSTSMWVQGVVENADSSPYFDVSQEFWDESGADSDGSWHEWVLDAKQEFRVDQPKEVYVRLFADPEAAAANAPVSFALEEGVMNWVPFLWFGLFSIVAGFIVLMIAGSGKRVWESMSD